MDTYIAMSSEVLQELDLPEGSLGQYLLAENIGDLLDCDPVTGLIICCSAAHGYVSSDYEIGAKVDVLLSEGQSRTRQYHKHPVPAPL